MARPRGAGAAFATLDGAIVVTAEGRGKRLQVRPGTAMGVVRQAVTALAALYLATGTRERPRDVIVETIDGDSASTSPFAAALLDAGFRSDGLHLRLYPSFKG
jgi:hypothetical protein